MSARLFVELGGTGLQGWVGMDWVARSDETSFMDCRNVSDGGAARVGTRCKSWLDLCVDGRQIGSLSYHNLLPEVADEREQTVY